MYAQVQAKNCTMATLQSRVRHNKLNGYKQGRRSFVHENRGLLALIIVKEKRGKVKR